MVWNKNLISPDTYQRRLKMLDVDEGCELMPYRDSKGILTIGRGRNLQDNGIRQKEADFMFENDLIDAEADCKKLFGIYWQRFSVNRQDVFVNLMYNMGYSRVHGFRRMIAAAKLEEWKECANELWDSKWRRDVGDGRATRLCNMLRNDVPHTA